LPECFAGLTKFFCGLNAARMFVTPDLDEVTNYANSKNSIIEAHILYHSNSYNAFIYNKILVYDIMVEYNN